MSRPHALALVAVFLVGHAFGYSPPHNPKRVVIKKFGFSIEAPVGWRAAGRQENGLPVFVNVPWSAFGPQLLLPKGGATMHVITEDGLPGGHPNYSLDKWLEFDQRLAKAGTASSARFEMPPQTAVIHALLSAFDEATYGPDDQSQRHVAVYWEFRGKRFAMHLFYVVSDPHGKQYEDLLANAVGSIRPL